MTSRDLAILGFRLASIWLRVQATAMILFAFLFVGWCIFLVFLDRDPPALLHIAYVLGGPIFLLLAARVLRYESEWFFPEQDDDEAGVAVAQRLVAPLTAALTLYGLWLTCSSITEFFSRVWLLPQLNYPFENWIANSGVQQQVAGMVAQSLVGLAFFTVGRHIAPLLLRVGTLSVVENDAAADSSPPQ